MSPSPVASPAASRPNAGIPAVALERIVKRFGDFEAVAGIDLEIADGEFSMLAPPGWGKTMTSVPARGSPSVDDYARHAYRPPLRRAACLRAVVRRGNRHPVHRRGRLVQRIAGEATIR